MVQVGHEVGVVGIEPEGAELVKVHEDLVGSLTLVDGNHRLAAAWFRDESEIMVQLVCEPEG